MKFSLIHISAVISAILFSLAVNAQTMDEKKQDSSKAADEHSGIAIVGLSTNVLMDAVSAVNIGLEVPVGHHWSLRAEYAMPWWSAADNSFVLKAQNVNIGARYYFKPWKYRSSDVYSGWFASITAGAGLYDVRMNYQGAQGQGLLGNIGGGYSFALGPWWRLDLSAGIGVMYSDRQLYQTNSGGTINNKDSAPIIVPDPTAFKVGIVYLFHIPGKK